MEIEDQLNKLKKQYISIEPSDSLAKHGWQALKDELELSIPPAKKDFKYKVFLASFFTIVFIGFSFGAVYASQKALPGDTLYPVKKVSEDLTVLVSGNRQVKIEKRAEEVIQAVESQKDKEVVRKTVKNYQEEVFKTKKDSEESGKSKEFKNQLENHEQQFNKVIKKGSFSDKEIEKAIEVSKKGRGGNQERDENEKSGKF